MRLRKARMSDADFLLAMKNDPESLKWSWSHDPVNSEDHAQWFKKALFYDEPRIWIAEVRGHPVGTIRMEYKDAGDEISFTVAPEWRGRGIGTAMLKAMKRTGGVKLVGYTDLENMASRRAFEKAGFKLYIMAVKE